MTRAGRSGTLIWALLALLAAVIVTRATYTADLSAFLPAAGEPTQRLLVEQLRAGPAAHLILAAIEGGDARSSRAGLGAARGAAASPTRPSSASTTGMRRNSSAIAAFLFRHRYLLSPGVTPQRFSPDGLHAAITDSLAALASPAGLLLKPLFVHDPTGEMAAIIDSMERVTSRTPASAYGARPMALVRCCSRGRVLRDRIPTPSRQPARPCGARSPWLVRSVPTAARAELTLKMSGPPVFAVASRATIKAEVLRLSCISAAVIAALLLACIARCPRSP